MDINKIKDWSQKYISGELTKVEKETFEAWYREIGADFPMLPDDRINKLREEIFEKLPGHTRKKFPDAFLLAAAGIAVVMVSLILQVVFHKSDLVVKNIPRDIPPGGNRAVLTLANGRQIDLAKAANGNLAVQAGLHIIKNGPGQVIYQDGQRKKQDGQPVYNTVSTPDGGIWQLGLPDGTKVWLNNSSALAYPATFAGAKQRTVELHGEAYFEVAKDKAHPFVVKSAEQEVRVFGTHFNIRAFKGDQVTQTTLLEGSVSVNSHDKPGAQVLKPGEQACFSHGLMTIGKVNINDAIAWKDGYFRFTDAPIEQVMRELSRWYGIEVRYEGPVPGENLNGKISRLKNISKVLAALEATKTVHFKVKGRRVTVMK
jgi:hypothetical protein